MHLLNTSMDISTNSDDRNVLKLHASEYTDGTEEGCSESFGDLGDSSHLEKGPLNYTLSYVHSMSVSHSQIDTMLAG